MKHILGEILIIFCKGSSYIIFFLLPAFGKLLELRKNKIITACPIAERTHKIMDFFSSVDAEYHIVHLPIDKGLYLVV